MNFNMFSIVVGNSACICKCPFCVSCENYNTKDNFRHFNERNFKIALSLATKYSGPTACITSYGEPLLFPDEITKTLLLIDKQIPFVELQTNGLLFDIEKEEYKEYLEKWYELGLTHIALSTVHYDRKMNESIYCNKSVVTKNYKYPDLKELIEYLHSFGFSVRLVCICFDKFIDSAQKIVDYVEFAKNCKAEQVTIRPLNLEYRRDDAKLFTHKHKLNEETVEEIKKCFDDNFDKLLVLPNIGEIYDVNGQNCLLSFPLNKNTRSMDIENTRNLIYFPDGHIRYEWEKTGGILL